ncbi:sodium:proton antiporter NhaD [Yeosuana sp.]|uniref:sodium:proton antiporter NhaD n=1 Tax=Yeosuana sp. TaxID=2529388 RepID=UPI00405501B6|tara:strand:+ start:603 stop:1910 length:1308 start_codon:yes stop_codon:yes gene_type:complete
MYLAIIIFFIIGYLAIALEHQIKINKTASALLTGVILWVLLVLGRSTFFSSMADTEALNFISESLLEHIGDISEILFFLLGAMTIVELIDAHEGFSIITDKIKITSRVKLIWVLCFITFFLSAALDNLTTAIVMSALLKKIIKDKNDLWIFAGMIIIAANAGGAWSPIGDVTTIMLWIGGQITASNIIFQILVPSMVNLIVPLLFLSFKLKGNIASIAISEGEHHKKKHLVSKFEKRLIFSVGIGALLFVPIFKSITHLPPFMGILFGLSIMWILTEILHRNKVETYKHSLSIINILQRIDTPSILFFLGILMAVAALQSGGYLLQLATVLDKTFDSIYIINTLIGGLSSVIDNVPMVAGAMGMYSLKVYPVDSAFWELLAYAAGTGGSILIIGSAAGVAIMGIFKIDFIWYMKKITLLAILGYLAGIATYMLLN